VVLPGAPADDRGDEHERPGGQEVREAGRHGVGRPIEGRPARREAGTSEERSGTSLQEFAPLAHLASCYACMTHGSPDGNRRVSMTRADRGYGIFRRRRPGGG
jgi:hypothetical protein